MEEFKTIKNNVKSENLKDIVKELERAILGHDDDDDDNEEPKYEESIAERTNNKKTINPKNNDHKCFQYAVTLGLNLDKINKHPQRISKIKPFIDQYNWKDVDFPSTSKDWRKLELHNEIALNILYVPHNIEKYKLLINQNKI